MKFSAKCQSIVDKLAASSCEDLFRAYEVALEPVPAPPPQKGRVLLCGVIGFTGDKIRGTCILAMTEEPLRGSSPEGGAERDWISELANQLAGRIKNKLLAHGAEVYITIPVVLRGEHLAPLPRHELEPNSFLALGGAVYVWVEVEATGDDALSIDPVQDTGIVEGDSLFF